jgi:hypothetical protein
MAKDVKNKSKLGEEQQRIMDAVLNNDETILAEYTIHDTLQDILVPEAFVVAIFIGIAWTPLLYSMQILVASKWFIAFVLEYVMVLFIMRKFPPFKEWTRKKMNFMSKKGDKN